MRPIMPQDKKLKRQKVELLKTVDGQYTIVPPKKRGLTLSGGGTKGIAYVGMIRSLDEKGQLKELTHVSGASAGAMTASLIAVGMSSENIATLVSELDLKKIFDKGSLRVRAKGDRFRNLFDVIYMVQINQHLEKVSPDLVEKKQVLTTKIALYQKALAAQGINITTVGDVIRLSQSSEGLQKLDNAFKSIQHDAKESALNSPHITLGDLGLLRELLPEKDKHLIKNLSVGVTNQSKKAFELYSEDTTPEQPLAQVVQWSGAHPVLFVPGVNAKGDYVADGGILDNMPEIDGLDREEVLCVKAETESAYRERVKKADESTPIMLSGFKRALDYLVQSTIGGSWLNSTATLLNREKVFYHLDNMLFINTGAITTISTSPTREQKEAAIKNAYDQTNALIDSQTKTFDHPLMAVLYVGLDKLDQALVNEDIDNPLFLAAGQAKMIAILQKQMVDDMNEGDYSSVQGRLNDIELILSKDAKMDLEQQEKALALCIKQVNFLSEGKLVNFMNQEVSTGQHWAIRGLMLILTPIKLLLSPVFFLCALIAKETMPTPIREIQRKVQEDIPAERKANLPKVEVKSDFLNFRKRAEDLVVEEEEDDPDEATSWGMSR